MTKATQKTTGKKVVAKKAIVKKATGSKGKVQARKNNLTELVFILDRSGSMTNLTSDTIGGFNSMIDKQKHEPGKVLVSTVLFDDETTVLHDRIELNEVPRMTDRDYETRGCTALCDAIGGAIRHIGNIHKYARAEDVPAHTLFIITTDGMENASRKYSADRVRQMIENQKTKYGWEFIFLGANIDAVETAQRFGIAKSRAVNYVCDSRGTSEVYHCMSQAVGAIRRAKCCQSKDVLDRAEWRMKLDEDFQTRSTK